MKFTHLIWSVAVALCCVGAWFMRLETQAASKPHALISRALPAVAAGHVPVADLVAFSADPVADMMAQPEVQTERRQEMKAILSPLIQLWERQHARYLPEEEGASGGGLTVELPPANPALLRDLRDTARKRSGLDVGDAVLDHLLAEDFSSLATPRRIVAKAHVDGQKFDQVQVLVPEPAALSDGSLNEVTSDVTAAAWMVSCTYTTRGKEPPEEFRHLLRFADE